MEILSDDQAAVYGVFAGPPSAAELDKFFLLDDADRELVRGRRGGANRLGFAVQLGTVRFLGTFLADPLAVPASVAEYVARQLAPKRTRPRRKAEGKWLNAKFKEGLETAGDQAAHDLALDHDLADPGGQLDLSGGRRAEARGLHSVCRVLCAHALNLGSGGRLVFGGTTEPVLEFVAVDAPCGAVPSARGQAHLHVGEPARRDNKFHRPSP